MAIFLRHLHTGDDGTVTTNDYYYLRNAQSDIIAIISGTGTKVVAYTCNSRGKPQDMTWFI